MSTLLTYFSGGKGRVLLLLLYVKGTEQAGAVATHSVGLFTGSLTQLKFSMDFSIPREKFRDTFLFWSITLFSYSFKVRSQYCGKLLPFSSCVSVRLSVRMYQLGSHWTDFHEIRHVIIFKNTLISFKFL
jgi:hypothetical protein